MNAEAIARIDGALRRFEDGYVQALAENPGLRETAPKLSDWLTDVSVRETARRERQRRGLPPAGAPAVYALAVPRDETAATLNFCAALYAHAGELATRSGDESAVAVAVFWAAVFRALRTQVSLVPLR